MTLLVTVIACFRCGQGTENSDGYLRTIAVKVLVIIVDDLEGSRVNIEDQGGRLLPNLGDPVRRKQVVNVLAEALGDTNADIRQLAVKKILLLAEAGDTIASSAVLQNIDICFELGFGQRDLGSNLRMEQGRVANHLEASVFVDAQSVKKYQTPENETIAALRSVSPASLSQNQKMLVELVEKGYISKLRDIAFPPKDSAAHEAQDEEIRILATKSLMDIARDGDQTAVSVILENLDEFFLFAGMDSLGSSSAQICARLEQQDHGITFGNSELVAQLVEQLSSVHGHESGTSIENMPPFTSSASGPAVKAAMELLVLAENGDPQASTAIVQHLASFLSGLGQAGIFRGKLRSASQALKGFVD